MTRFTVTAEAESEGDALTALRDVLDDINNIAYQAGFPTKAEWVVNARNGIEVRATWGSDD